MNLILLVGSQGSGKSTLAKTEFESYTYVNQDLQGKKGHFDQFLAHINQKLDIVVDRINHTKNQRLRYLEVAKANGYSTKIVVLHVPKEECLARCKARLNHSSIKDEKTASRALHSFFKSYERVSDDEADVVERRYHSDQFKQKSKCVVFDIDNTIADNKHREHFMTGEKKDWKGFFSQLHNDTPVKAVEFLYLMTQTYNDNAYETTVGGYDAYERPPLEVVFCSARPDDYRAPTEEWLANHGFAHQYLFMRERDDFRQDALIKENILDFEILTRYDIMFWADDRDQVVERIRNRGIAVFQVAPGEF